MDEATLVSAVALPAAVSPLSAERLPGASLADHAPLHQYFGVQAGDPIQESQLKSIWDFAVSRAGTEDRDQVVAQVTALRHMLGTGILGDKPWMKIMTYIAALTDMKKAESTIRDLTL